MRIKPVSCQAAHLGFHFLPSSRDDETENTLHLNERQLERKVEERPALGGI